MVGKILGQLPVARRAAVVPVKTPDAAAAPPVRYNLDGWRAISILSVLAGHLLPIGPKAWELNGAVAATGMVIFFNLSGFLIVSFLLRDPNALPFIVRRLFRIVPLAWAAIAVLALWTMPDFETLAANLVFISNIPPTRLMHGGEHLWSLCIEVQFYAGVAILVAVAGARGLYILPLVGLAVTAARVQTDAFIGIYTWQRADEILAGATIALAHHHGLFQRYVPRRLALWAFALMPLIVLTGHPAGGALNFARPWISALAIAMTLVALPTLIDRAFRSRAALYIAATSYALYVIHGMLMFTWLGDGGTVEKYLKRPLLFAATFALAHVSTFWFEARMIAIGRRLAERVGERGA